VPELRTEKEQEHGRLVEPLLERINDLLDEGIGELLTLLLLLFLSFDTFLLLLGKSSLVIDIAVIWEIDVQVVPDQLRRASTGVVLKRNV
jgi:hypothetical protein